DPLYLLIPKDWGKETASGIGDLASRAWAMEERGKPAREWAVSRCRQEGFEPDIRYESNDLLVHVKLVQAGHAVTFTPGLLWQTVARTDRLLGPPGAPTRKIFTAVREGMQDRPDIKAFRAEILALTTKV